MEVLFWDPLIKVLHNIHPSIKIRDDALKHMNSICFQLFRKLINKSVPYTLKEMENRVNNRCPSVIADGANKEAREAIYRYRKMETYSILFSYDKVHALLLKEFPNQNIDRAIAIYLAAVLEYVAADILKLSTNYSRRICANEITMEHINEIVSVNSELGILLNSNVTEEIDISTIHLTLTYDDMFIQFIKDERKYKRDLEILIFLFKKKFQEKLGEDAKIIEELFSNIEDIYELTDTFMGYLDDVIEVSDSEGQASLIGNCFEDLAMYAEFDVYINYLETYNLSNIQTAINTILKSSEIKVLCNEFDSSNGVSLLFELSIKYYLPKLLVLPVQHLQIYFNYIEKFIKLTPSSEDQQSYKQVQGLLIRLREKLKNCLFTLPTDALNHTNGRTRRQAALHKIQELKRSVKWGDTEMVSFREYYREDTMRIIDANKKIKEKRVFLFNDVLLLCNQLIKRTDDNLKYEFKELIDLRKVIISDVTNSDNKYYAFRLTFEKTKSIIFIVNTLESKNNWMADFIIPNAKKVLRRATEKILLEIKQEQTLQFPNSETYKFFAPDVSSNIIFDDSESTASKHRMIKGATIYKLVEHITHHVYASPSMTRTFLITYRAYTTPAALLDLLIDRFNIPVEQCNMDKDFTSQAFKLVILSRKLFQREYILPVKLRVLNLMRQWVKKHFYDFERDHMLLQKLVRFLICVQDRSLQKWAKGILDSIPNKTNSNNMQKMQSYAFNQTPPNILHHLEENVPESEFNLLNLHPLELARQLTLLEFDLFKIVEPSELIKQNGDSANCPNLAKIWDFTTNVTRWIEKSIVETENFEERQVMVSRTIELMKRLEELNNFNSVFAIISALGSAPVHRLIGPLECIPKQYENFYCECQTWIKDNFKVYKDKLHSINPPCVPFLGMYYTNLIHCSVGIKNELHQLINFSKWTKIAEITEEIQQYQNEPYCLNVEPRIKNFLTNLKPFEGLKVKEIDDILFEKSEKIQPRNCPHILKFPRKYSNILNPGPLKKLSATFKDFTLKPTRKISAELRNEGSEDNEDKPPPLPPRKNVNQ